MNKMISDEYAVYLPAVNLQYATIITKPLPATRPFPNTLTLDDLMFWRSKNKLFYQPHYLHSVGQYKVGSKVADNAVMRRGKTDGILFGDSGGYQIGNGSLDGIKTLKGVMEADDACLAWREAYDVRNWILGWLETYTNYAMTIDMPLWARDPAKSNTPFHKCSPEQLIQLTVENLQFIDSHRQHQTKWLNVLQGTDMTAIKQWWDAVKWFKGSGYALSSLMGRKLGLGGLLEPLLMMRDEKAFDKGKDWIHILGVSTATWAIMFTAIQKALKENANSNIRLSYDSSSPFKDAGIMEKYEILPTFGNKVENWVIQKKQFPHSGDYLDSIEPWPCRSPIADKMTLGHMNVRDEHGMFTPLQFDTLSLSLLANHNIWTYFETFRQANELVFASQNRNDVPDTLKSCVDVIEYIFTVENWKGELIKHATLLEQFKG